MQLPVGADRDAVIDALAAEGIPSKAYLPCIHTMPPYRERFGFKGGEFPVAEARGRALAGRCPSSPSMTEQQVERVCTALAGALGGPS